VTEAEWLACTDARRMLTFLRPPPNDRKGMLFAVACCRAVWSRLPRPDGLPGLDWAEAESLQGVRWAEEHADVIGTPDFDLRRLIYGLEAAVLHWQSLMYFEGRKREKSLRGQIEDTDDWSDHDLRHVAGHIDGTLLEPQRFTEAELDAISAQWGGAADLAYRLPDLVDRSGADALEWVDEGLLPPDLLRDIFGNPFRPAAIDPRWLTSTAVSLAGAIYEERAFDRLPILADALEDAGCDNADILTHLRGEGPHARGCWAVDLVLGKG
jgi:hypothetical protein